MTSSIKDTTVTDAPLLPCPFCGQEALSKVDNDEWEIARVDCINMACRASGPHVNLGDFCSFDEAEAAGIAAWNTRSMESKPDPEGDGQVPELIEEMRLAVNGLGKLTGAQKQAIESATGYSVDALACLYVMAISAIAAKPSLEPTRTELVEAAREIYEQGFRDGFVEAHVDESGPPDEEATLKRIDGVSLAEAWDANSDVLLKTLMGARRG